MCIISPDIHICISIFLFMFILKIRFIYLVKLASDRGRKKEGGGRRGARERRDGGEGGK